MCNASGIDYKTMVQKLADRRREGGQETMNQNQELTFAVLGAGHGGQALAAYLSLKGFRVNLLTALQSG